jgi:hypothetical protein
MPTHRCCYAQNSVTNIRYFLWGTAKERERKGLVTNSTCNSGLILFFSRCNIFKLGLLTLLLAEGQGDWGTQMVSLHLGGAVLSHECPQFVKSEPFGPDRLEFEPLSNRRSA